MQEIIQNNIRVTVDDAGFLTDLDGWTDEVARVLAAGEGIRELTVEQFNILRSLRSYYRKYSFFPIMRSICANVQQPRTCITDKFSDPVTAWKLAGLPNPGEEVNNFRSWEPLGY